MKIRKLVRNCALAAGLGVIALNASAEPYRAAVWLGEASPHAKFMYDFTNRIKKASNGQIGFDVYTGGSLMPAKGSLDGLSARVADLVFVTGAYLPSDLPYDNVLSDVSFVSKDQLTLAFSSLETKFNNPKIQQELAKHNAVYIAGMAIGLYHFICNDEIDSLDDLRGKKVRTIGAALVNWMSSVGAVPVNVPGSEIYTGLQRGSIDCTLGTPLFLTDYFKLAEVAKSVNNLPMGSLDTGGFYLNRDFWKSLTPEQRRLILNASADATAHAYVVWADKIDQAYAEARKAGISVIEPDDKMLARLTAFQQDYLKNLPQTEMKRRHIPDPTDLIDDDLQALEKWKGLLANVDRNDPEALAALIKKEIYDKIDVRTYGLN